MCTPILVCMHIDYKFQVLCGEDSMSDHDGDRIVKFNDRHILATHSTHTQDTLALPCARCAPASCAVRVKCKSQFLLSLLRVVDVVLLVLAFVWISFRRREGLEIDPINGLNGYAFQTAPAASNSSSSRCRCALNGEL